MNFYFLGFLIIPLMLITACGDQTREYKLFVEKYGSETRTYCDGGFKMKETFISPKASAPEISLIDSNECNITIEEKIKSRK